MKTTKSPSRAFGILAKAGIHNKNSKAHIDPRVREDAKTNPILQLTQISRHYSEGPTRIDVLTNISLTLHAGESVAIVGPSGCGKSTLLHIAGLLDSPNAGTVHIMGTDATHLPDTPRAHLRNQRMGFVYQHHHLLREFTALENVMMPARIAGKLNEARATELLTAVGLSHRLHHAPSQLSGGEQQRVAIARALMNHPALLLADEPTGNLDPHTADTVTNLLFSLIEQQSMAALIVTHNMALARRCTRIVKMG